MANNYNTAQAGLILFTFGLASFFVGRLFFNFPLESDDTFFLVLGNTCMFIAMMCIGAFTILLSTVTTIAVYKALVFTLKEMVKISKYAYNYLFNRNYHEFNDAETQTQQQTQTEPQPSQEVRVAVAP